MSKPEEDFFEANNNIGNIISKRDGLLIELTNAKEELNETINNIDELEDNETYKQYRAILNEYNIAINLYKKNGKESLKSHISNLERNVEAYKSKLNKKEESGDNKVKKIILDLNEKINSLDKIIKGYFDIKYTKQVVIGRIDDILIPKISMKN